MPYTPVRSPADVAEHLRLGEAREDDFLDLKGSEPYPGRSDVEDRAECARDIAQFANATGGVLVIGATEASGVLTGFQTVADPEKIRSWIDRVASGQLRPVPVFDTQEIVTESGETIVTVNVAPHPTLVARYSDKRYQFVMRVGTSKHYLEINELEARMQGRERVMRFRLEQIPSDAQVGLDARIRQLTHNDWRVVRVTEDVVRLSKNGHEVVVPLEYVDAVYRSEETNAEWVIRLSCFIMSNDREGGIFLAKEVPHGYVADAFNTRWY